MWRQINKKFFITDIHGIRFSGRLSCAKKLFNELSNSQVRYHDREAWQTFGIYCWKKETMTEGGACRSCFALHAVGASLTRGRKNCDTWSVLYRCPIRQRITISCVKIAERPTASVSWFCMRKRHLRRSAHKPKGPSSRPWIREPRVGINSGVQSNLYLFAMVPALFISMLWQTNSNPKVRFGNTRNERADNGYPVG